MALEPPPDLIQSLEASRLLTQQSTQSADELKHSKEKLANLERSRQLAGRVLNSYPDYAKSPPDYTARIIEAFSYFPADIQEAMASTRKGLAARCAYLPTVADVVKMGEELQTAETERAERSARYAGLRRTEVEYEPRRGNHFPQLTEAFKAEPHLLQKPFCALDEACHRLFHQSFDSARAFLLAYKPYEGKAGEKQRPRKMAYGERL